MAAVAVNDAHSVIGGGRCYQRRYRCAVNNTIVGVRRSRVPFARPVRDGSYGLPCSSRTRPSDFARRRRSVRSIMVYLHFPTNLTEEELMLQNKYQKLRKKVIRRLLRARLFVIIMFCRRRKRCKCKKRLGPNPSRRRC